MNLGKSTEIMDFWNTVYNEPPQIFNIFNKTTKYLPANKKIEYSQHYKGYQN